MKRFRSNLQRVHALCEQQSRMARLALVQRQQELATAEQALYQAQNELHARRQSGANVFRQRVPSAMVQSMQQELAVIAKRLQQCEQQRQATLKSVAQAAEEYRQLKTRVDRLAELIARQRQQHRREALRDQQNTMDELSGARRFRDERHGEHSPHTGGIQENRLKSQEIKKVSHG